MENIRYEFDISQEKKEYIDHNLELYNFSKNVYLNHKIYKEQKKFGFYAYRNNKIVGGAYGFINDYYWGFLDLLFVDE